MSSYHCVKELPAVLDRSYVYLSTMQRDRLRQMMILPHFVHEVSEFLPCWVPHRTLATIMGIPVDAIEQAEQEFGFYVWATEFENVHSTWAFEEPTLSIDGSDYNDSEDYYHKQKPVPWDERIWDAKKIDVMTKGVFEKLLRSEDARKLLLSTWDHPLVSIKKDRFWGFHPSKPTTSANALAAILVYIRAHLRWRLCDEVSRQVRSEIYRVSYSLVRDWHP